MATDEQLLTRVRTIVQRLEIAPERVLSEWHVFVYRHHYKCYVLRCDALSRFLVGAIYIPHTAPPLRWSKSRAGVRQRPFDVGIAFEDRHYADGTLIGCHTRHLRDRPRMLPGVSRFGVTVDAMAERLRTYIDVCLGPTA